MSWFKRDTHLTEADISAYIDGELPAARAASVRAHIDACDPCRTVLDELTSVKTMLTALPRPPTAGAAPRATASTRDPSPSPR